VRFDVNISIVLDEVTCDDSVFHSFAAATGKDRSPIVQSHVDGTASAEVKERWGKQKLG